ncbi:MAG: T9SS type A sorting domain-containing protein [Bacteroidia bacterium]
MSPFYSSLKWLSLLSLTLCSFATFAQDQASHTVFTTGGTFNSAGNLVKLYTQASGAAQPTVALSSAGDFSNAVLADHRYIYMHVGRAAGHPAGKDAIIRFDLITGMAIDSAKLGGVQRMAVNSEFLFVTRGFGADSNYLQVFDKNDLAKGPVFSDTDIPTASARAIVVTEDEAWVSFDENGKGNIASYDMESSIVSFAEIFPMDSLEAGIHDMYLTGTDLIALAQIVDFPPPNFSPVLRHASVVTFDTPTGMYSTDTSISRVNTGSALIGNKVYADFGGGLQGYEYGAMTPTYTDTLFKNGFTASTFNRVDSVFVMQETDYFSFGRIAMVPYANPANVSTFTSDISGAAVDVVYNYAPEARDTAFTMVTPSVPVDASPLFSDQDGDALSLVWLEYSAGSQLVNFLPNGQITFLGNQSGTGRFAIVDGFGGTDTADFSVDILSSIEPALPRFSLYPNPAQNILNLDFGQNLDQVEIDIVSLQGKRLQRQTLPQGTETQINIESLCPGMYYCVIKLRSGNVTQRFVKR